MKVPPPFPTKIGSRKSRRETTPDTPGSPQALTILASACSPSSESAGGSPWITITTRSTKGERKRSPAPGLRFAPRCLPFAPPFPAGAQREKKRGAGEHGCEDQAGQPETARMDEIHDVMKLGKLTSHAPLLLRGRRKPEIDAR